MNGTRKVYSLQIFRCEYITWSNHGYQENKRGQWSGGQKGNKQDTGDMSRKMKKKSDRTLIGKQQFNIEGGGREKEAYTHNPRMKEADGGGPLQFQGYPRYVVSSSLAQAAKRESFKPREGWEFKK